MVEVGPCCNGMGIDMHGIIGCPFAELIGGESGKFCAHDFPSALIISFPSALIISHLCLLSTHHYIFLPLFFPSSVFTLRRRTHAFSFRVFSRVFSFGFFLSGFLFLLSPSSPRSGFLSSTLPGFLFLLSPSSPYSGFLSSTLPGFLSPSPPSGLLSPPI